MGIAMMPKINFMVDIARNSGGRVIEVGCGPGYLTLELARNGLDVTGIDLSPKSIEIAQKFAEENTFKDGFGSLKYSCGDFLSMELDRNAYDSIIFFGTLHHMPDMDVVMSKLKEILKTGGNFIICEPVRDNFTKKSAELTAILRAILPTWIPYDKKLEGLSSSVKWKDYIEDIFKECTYQDEHEQSPCDNATSYLKKVMIDSISKHFDVKTVEYSHSFIDNLIGGLRGPDKYILAKSLKALDDYLVEQKILLPTSIRVHAVKR